MLNPKYSIIYYLPGVVLPSHHLVHKYIFKCGISKVSNTHECGKRS